MIYFYSRVWTIFCYCNRRSRESYHFASRRLEWTYECGPKSRHLLSLLVRSSKPIAIMPCRVYSVAINPAWFMGINLACNTGTTISRPSRFSYYSIALFFIANRRTNWVASRDQKRKKDATFLARRPRAYYASRARSCVRCALHANRRADALDASRTSRELGNVGA